MNNTFRTVTIAGATGNVGYYIAEAFLNDGSYKIKILRRKPENLNKIALILASKGAKIVYADYDQKDDLVNALRGTDVLVSVASGADLDVIQLPLLTAAKEANVKRFIPSEYGSEANHPYLEGKIRFRKMVEKSGLDYTFLFTGLFQENLNFIGFDLENKRARFCIDGDRKISTTSLADIGRFTVESLKVPEARNAYIRVAGGSLSLNEILQKFEEASGSKWQVIKDKEVRHRFRNNIEPVPTLLEDFAVEVMEKGGYFEKTDNDKFNFTPRSLTEAIEFFVKTQA